MKADGSRIDHMACQNSYFVVGMLCLILGSIRSIGAFRIPSYRSSLFIPSRATSCLVGHNSWCQQESWRALSSTVHSTQEDIDEDLIELGRSALAGYFNFPLDDWQLKAGGAICQGCNVIVCAPTGAGKTVVGEMALLHAFNGGDKGIYTTPLKALSNQKYSELCGTFPKQDTGLSTGDISINKGARITVMTTEVYRNIAWRSSTPTATLMGTNELLENTVVVLDEFHYMGQPGRGGVWEESIITSPSHTQIVGLSATLSNAAALAAWMEHVTGRRTILVEVPGQERPVPLRYLFATKEALYPLFRDPDAGPGAPKGLLGYRGDGDLPSNRQSTKKAKGFTHIMDGDDVDDDETNIKIPRGLQINPALKAAANKRMQKVNRAIERQKVRRHLSPQEDEDDWGGRKRNQSSRKMSPRDERKERERLLKNEMRRSVPSLPAILNRLKQKELLPAIFFIFSRAGCDDAARQVYQYMKGPRDPNCLLQDEREQLGIKEEQRYGTKKGKSRQRAVQRRGDLVEDSDGRTFRSKSNFISEQTLNALEMSTPLADDEFDESSPLSPDNWDFFSKAGLLSYAEVRDVASRVSRFNAGNPEIAFEDEVIEQYLFGAGSHHAGMLPAHKSFVEILYRNQLMKVVFATETLAAGINMPARTTVICALAKRGDNSAMNLLETSNLLQMAGRAGRRGMDTDGTCVIVATPFENHDEASRILIDPVKPISSQFSPSYSLAINLIARGEGKLDVARQLVSKSFAMWEKRKVEQHVVDAVENHGDDVSQALKVSAQDRFMKTLVDALQSQVDQRSAKFDVNRVESLLGILTDRDSLKKTSKSFVGATKMFELEYTTLSYLQKEYDALRARAEIEDSDFLCEIIAEDTKDLINQIENQRKRVETTEKEIGKHPFSIITGIANQIMEDAAFPESIVLNKALGSAREGHKRTELSSLTAQELSQFSKSAIVVTRKMRKVKTANPDVEDLFQQAEDLRNDSWNDMLSITKTLVAYGCLSIEHTLEGGESYEDQQYTISPAGINIGMLGFENSLWALVAMGGAWDVVGASAKLDDFRTAMEDFDNDEDWYQNRKGNDVLIPPKVVSIPISQKEANTLNGLLRAMDPSELAGYVASIVTDNSRGNGAPVVQLFQNLTPLQQRVIQSSLVSMERLVEVQKLYGVDEKTRSCILDISNCEVVTAWASGCSWQEALEISGSPPGDLARTLSRVLDAVRQLGNMPYSPIRKQELLDGPVVWDVSWGLHPEIRRLCRDAARLINRYPVKDPLQFEELDDEDVEILDEIEQFFEEDEIESEA